MDGVAAFGAEEHDDGVEEADEGEGGDVAEEGLVVGGAEEGAEGEAGEDGCS